MASVKAPLHVAKELRDKELAELGEKYIAEYLSSVPEADREKFIETARELILDRYNDKATPIIIIIDKNGMLEYGKALGKITNGRDKDSLEILRSNLAQTAEKLELYVLMATTGKSIEWIQENLAKEIQDFAKYVRKDRKDGTYQYKEETLQLLQKLGIDIDN